MDSAQLQALAKEREARRGPPTTAPVPASWAKKPSAAPASADTARLATFHRSIKLSRSIGLALDVFAVLMMLFGAGWRVVLVFFIGGAGLARGGAALTHSLLPEMLYEGSKRPPTKEEIAEAANIGLWSVEGVKKFGASLSAECALSLDSLAWACTYGKKNCLTDQMYTGPLSFGKVLGLVWGKLREGVIRC